MAGAVELLPGGVRESRSRALTVVSAPRIHAAPSRWLRLPPPVLALALTIAALTLHALVPGAAAPWAQSVPLGIVLGLVGFGWMGWAHALLRRADTPVPPGATPRVLVDEGPYRFGRNPIYLGMVVTMLGIGLALGAPLMAVAAANFVAIVSSVHIPHEEANMRRVFGGWYSDYAASVRRWF